MSLMRIKIINKSNNPLPAYETKGASGMDVCAFVEGEPIVIPPAIATEIDPHNGRKYSDTTGKLNRALVKTGLTVEIPESYEMQVRPRSGLALKKGITVLNSPGTVDADYRGEIGVILINHSTEPFTVSNGDKIAQLVIAPVSKVIWKEEKELKATERGGRGFGHTSTRDEAVQQTR